MLRQERHSEKKLVIVWPWVQSRGSVNCCLFFLGFSKGLPASDPGEAGWIKAKGCSAGMEATSFLELSASLTLLYALWEMLWLMSSSLLSSLSLVSFLSLPTLAFLSPPSL